VLVGRPFNANSIPDSSFHECIHCRSESAGFSTQIILSDVIEKLEMDRS
jgi:hypothetical protein